MKKIASLVVEIDPIGGHCLICGMMIGATEWTRWVPVNNITKAKPSGGVHMRREGRKSPVEGGSDLDSRHSSGKQQRQILKEGRIFGLRNISWSLKIYSFLNTHAGVHGGRAICTDLPWWGVCAHTWIRGAT